MALVTKNPTANESPDTGQAGSLAVTTPLNTGHASTTAADPGVGVTTKTCRWSGFQSVLGQILSVKLKFSWMEDGSITGAASNLFQTAYSLNGGSTWTNVFNHIDVVAPTSSSSEVALAVNQDLTQIQVRDTLISDNTGGGSCNVTASVSTIRIEVVTVDVSPVVLM